MKSVLLCFGFDWLLRMNLSNSIIRGGNNNNNNNERKRRIQFVGCQEFAFVVSFFSLQCIVFGENIIKFGGSFCYYYDPRDSASGVIL